MRFKTLFLVYFTGLTLIKTVACKQIKCEKELSTGNVVLFCCNNHEERNGQCLECKDGFKSIDGKPCERCPYGWWGRKCKMICNCNVTQRCDHIDGCTKKLPIVAPTIETRIERGPCSDMDRCSTESSGEATIVRVDRITTSKDDEGLLAKEPFLNALYITVTGILMLCCLLVSCFKDKVLKWCKRTGDRQQQIQPSNQNRAHMYIDVVDERMYESIDEHDMDDEIRVPSEYQFNDNTSSNLNEISENEMSIQRNSYQKCSSTNLDKHQYNETNTHLSDSRDSERESACDANSSDDRSSDGDGYLKPVIVHDV